MDGNYDNDNHNLINTWFREEKKIILSNLIDECKKDGILINIREDNKDHDIEYYEYCINTYLDKLAEIINIQNLTHLPKDVLNNMSSFVSGEKGTIIIQINKLKSKLPKKPIEKNIFVGESYCNSNFILN